jgi:hypothetical protein
MKAPRWGPMHVDVSWARHTAQLCCPVVAFSFGKAKRATVQQQQQQQQQQWLPRRQATTRVAECSKHEYYVLPSRGKHIACIFTPR